MEHRSLKFGAVALWSLIGLSGGCFADPSEEDEVSSSTGAQDDASSTSSVDASDGAESSSGGSIETDGGESTGEPSTTSNASGGGPGTTVFRAVHAAPQVGPVDVYVAGSDEPVFEGLEYGDATNRIDVLAGEYQFQFRPAGAASSERPVHETPPLFLEEGALVTAVAAGLLSSDDDADRFRVLPVVEDWGAPLAGRARARVVHVGADAPDFRLDAPGSDADGSVGRFEATPAEGFPLEVAGGEQLELLDDLEDGAAQLTSFTTPPVADGDEVLLIATGLLGRLAREPEGFSVVAIGRDGSLGVVRQDPQLFVLHGSRDAGNLETCTGDTELAANFEYGEIQSTRVTPGSYDVSIYDYPSGCSGDAFNTNTTGDLEPGERYLLLVTGEVAPEDAGEASVQVTTFSDAFAVDSDDALLRFVHGASYSQIYVGSVVQDQIVGPNVYTDPISWSVESDEVELMPGFYQLGIADAVGEPEPPYAPLVSISYDAVAGARQWAIVSGDPSPEGEDDGFLQVMVVDTTVPQWSVALVDVTAG